MQNDEINSKNGIKIEIKNNKIPEYKKNVIIGEANIVQIIPPGLTKPK